jgi:hypothetical protein
MATTVQSFGTANIALSTTPTVVSFSGNVTTGSSVVVFISTNAASSTLAVSDGINSSYSIAVNSGSTHTRAVFYKHNVTGGFANVSVTSSVTGSNCRVGLLEVTGLNVSGTIQTDILTDGVSATSHTCGATGVTGTGLSACVSSLNAVTTTTTNETNLWTLDVARIAWYKIGTVTAYQGAFTTLASVLDRSAMAFFPDAAGGPPSAITNLSGTAVSSTQVDLAWTAATGAASHRVERATVP